MVQDILRVISLRSICHNYHYAQCIFLAAVVDQGEHGRILLNTNVEHICLVAWSCSYPPVEANLLQLAHDMLQGADPGLDLDALAPPATGRAADAGALADCPVLTDDAGQSPLGAALALHAALCGARCPPLQYPEPPGSSGPASAPAPGPTAPAEEDAAPGAEAGLPGAEAGLRGAAAASPAAALGAAVSSGAAALLARTAEAVPLLLDAASERQVVCL